MNCEICGKEIKKGDGIVVSGIWVLCEMHASILIRVMPENFAWPIISALRIYENMEGRQGESGDR